MNDSSNNYKKEPVMTSLGQAMPKDLNTPILKNGEFGMNSSYSSYAKPSKLSMVEEGLTFTGNATLQSTCTIAGQLIGHLKERAGESSHIVITESGSVKGDIVASKVSVMGTCTGLIDASGGSVDLHAKSVVNGHIRYGQLQVNGADLNATLERVAKASPKAPSRLA